MSCISEIVQNALRTGYLTLDAENLLRQMLQTTHYGAEEIMAFANLQIAAMTGLVRQESREVYRLQVIKTS